MLTQWKPTVADFSASHSHFAEKVQCCWYDKLYYPLDQTLNQASSLRYRSCKTWWQTIARLISQLNIRNATNLQKPHEWTKRSIETNMVNNLLCSGCCRCAQRRQINCCATYKEYLNWISGLWEHLAEWVDNSRWKPSVQLVRETRFTDINQVSLSQILHITLYCLLSIFMNIK